jgi:phospholipid/cholesterol/gamma-HCH transport system ATP-binding protein
MVLLDQGKFITAGTPQQLKESTDPLVHQFIYGLSEGPLSERHGAEAFRQDLLKRK